MSNRAKKWMKESYLRSNVRNEILVEKKDGGYAGSLTGLGYLTRMEEGGNVYKITPEGFEWLGYKE